MGGQICFPPKTSQNTKNGDFFFTAKKKINKTNKQTNKQTNKKQIIENSNCKNLQAPFFSTEIKKTKQKTKQKTKNISFLYKAQNTKKILKR